MIHSVQLLSCVWLFATPWITACQASLSITNSQSSLKLMFIESMMPSSHLILCRPLFLLPPIPPSIRVFQWVNSSHEVAKVLEFQLQHQSFHEHPGLISFRMDWLDLLAVQGTLKSLLQHHSSKASILRHSAFFTAQLLHPYMTTGKTIPLTKWTFVGKVMSLLFNILSGFKEIAQWNEDRNLWDKLDSSNWEMIMSWGHTEDEINIPKRNRV